MRQNEPTHDGTSANGTNNTSRRRFMAASALVGTGAFGLAGPVGSVAADGHGGKSDGTDTDGMDEKR